MNPRPTSSDTRTRLPRTERRLLLLEAALAAFSDEGYHATAMDDIAERAGVSKPVLYQHFDSKLDLYLALARHVGEELTSTIEESLVATTTDDHERVVAGLGSFFEFVDRPGAAYRLVFASEMRGEPAVAEVVDRTHHQIVRAIARILQARTGLSEVQGLLLGTAMVGAAEATATSWAEGDLPIPREEAVELLSALVWHGTGGFPVTDAATSSQHGDGHGGGPEEALPRSAG